MAISPNDFSLWARLTGNKYPSTPRERAQKGPEVHNFIQNLDKEGMLGGKKPEQPKREKNLAEKVATGALIAGGVAALGAAARDKRVQDVAQRAASATKTKIDDFLSNLGKARVVDVDIVDASGDVTPNPREQQSNIAPQLKSGPESIKPGGLGSRIIGPLPDVSLQDSADFMAKRINDPTYGAYGEDVQAVNIEDLNRESAQLAAFTGETIPRRDPVSGVSYEDIKQKLQDTAAARGVKQPVAVDSYTPLVQGKTFFTEGAISKEDPYGDIGNVERRVERTYGKDGSNLEPVFGYEKYGKNARDQIKKSVLREATRGREFDLGYMNAMARGRTDEAATITGRKFGGFDTEVPVGPQTPYRKALSELKIASTVPAKIDDLLKLVETGPQINLPESVQEPGALVQLAAGSTPSNKVPTMGATIGGSSLTDKHATKMAVDNALDNVRAKLTGTPVPITGVRIEGPSNIQKSGPGVVVDKEGNVVGDANYRSGQRELPIVYSTERETNQQMRRIEPTAEQSIAIRQEQGEVSKDRKGNMMITSPTYDSLTGFKTPSSETVASTPLEERIGRLESKTAELRAIQENLSRAGELMSAGLDPRTTRFDSARAAGLTSRSGITPRITDTKFQENVNLGKTQEAALPKESQRVFFEQDESGKIIPQSVQLRDERQAVKGPDTKTIESGGGYQPRGGVGSSIGAYGVEPSDFAQADITKKPTEISLPKTARDKRGMSDLSNQAVIKLTGSSSKGTARKAREELSVRDPGGTGSISDPTKVNAGETFDVAREVQRIQSDATIPPEKRRLSKEGLNELVERVRNRRALNLPTNLKQSPFFYQNGD